MMETKGRRAPRAARPIEAPAEPVNPIEVPALAEQSAEAPTEPLEPTDILDEAAKPTETAIDFVAPAVTPAPQPGVAALTKVAKSTSPDLAHFGRDTFAALAQSQAALAQGLEALSVEMAGLALSGIDTAARTATKMLGIKTLSDAIEVNAGFTCSSLDALVGGSVKLSELGARLAAETSQPILTQFGKDWIKASRLGS